MAKGCAGISSCVFCSCVCAAPPKQNPSSKAMAAAPPRRLRARLCRIVDGVIYSPHARILSCIPTRQGPTSTVANLPQSYHAREKARRSIRFCDCEPLVAGNEANLIWPVGIGLDREEALERIHQRGNIARVEHTAHPQICDRGIGDHDFRASNNASCARRYRRACRC